MHLWDLLARLAITLLVAIVRHGRRRMRWMCAPCACGRVPRARGSCWIFPAARSTACSVLKNPDRIVLDVAGARLASGSRAPAGHRGRETGAHGDAVPRASCESCSTCRGPYERRASWRRRTTATAIGWSSTWRQTPARDARRPSRWSMRGRTPAIWSSPSTPGTAGKTPVPSARTAPARRTWCSPSPASWR